MKRGHLVRALVLLAILIAAFLFVREGASLETLRTGVESFGPWAWAGFIILYAIGTILLIPGSIMTIMGGILFGTLFGTILVSVASTIGATGSFLLGRHLGRDAFEDIGGKRLAELQKRVQENGMEAVVVLRLVGFIPFNVLNYGLGLTRIKTWQYILGSWLGMLPGTFVYVYAGAIVGEVFLTEGYASLTGAALQQLILPASLLVLLAIIPISIRYWKRRNNGKGRQRQDS